MDQDRAYEPDVAPEPESPARARLGPTAYTLIGLLVGFLLGFAVAWMVGGNPFSGANEVVFRELVVEQIDEEEGRICWAVDPGRRDSPLECAILALDPAAAAPEEGQELLVGIVEVRTPDGQDFRQVVHVGQPAATVDDD